MSHALLDPPLIANLSSSHVGCFDWGLNRGLRRGPTWHLLREFEVGFGAQNGSRFQSDIDFRSKAGGCNEEL